MDFSTTIYDSTGQENFFRPDEKECALTSAEQSVFLRNLMRSVELPALGGHYFEQISDLLPVSSVSLTDYDSHLIYGSTQPQPGVCIELAAVSENLHAETAQKRIYYTFTRSPTREQQAKLEVLHYLFCQQLDHAVLFRQLRQMATKDTLTALGNRNGFNEACQRLICRAQRHDSRFGLLVIDLDNFKAVNDNYGHQEGDNVLVHVAGHISQVLRGADEAFRFGGDEFCCLVDCASNSQLNAIASRLQAVVSASAYLRRYAISCSIGGAVFNDTDDLASLFARADSALYVVKQTGKDAFRAA